MNFVSTRISVHTTQVPLLLNCSGESVFGISLSVLSPAALSHTGAMQSHSSSSAALQPPIPGKPPRAEAFSPGTALPALRPPVPLPVPLPRGAFPDTGNFSFRGNSSLLQKDQHLKPNETGDVPLERERALSQTLEASSASATDVHSTKNTSSATTLTSSGTSFSAAPAPSSHKAPGPPGMPGFVGPSAPTLSSPAVSATDSSSVRIPIISASPAATNPSVQQHMYPPFPVPPIGAPSQGQWVPPLQISGGLRPPYIPYPPVYPGPFPLAARATVLLPAVSSNSQPLGVTPVGDIGVALTSAASITEAEREIPPPGTEKNIRGSSFGCKDTTVHNNQAEAWSAHRTETGAVYYYNAISGESTYEKPPGFQGEPDKVTAQPTPVSWEKLAGTDWALVTTNDRKKYYYNTKTKVSSWQIPTDVIELKKRQESADAVEQSMSVSNSDAVVTDKGPITTTVAPLPSTTLSAPALNTGGRDSAALRTLGAVGAASAGSSAALNLIKKKLQDSGIPASSSMMCSTGLGSSDANGSGMMEPTAKGLQSENSKEKPKETDGDGNLSDLSSDSEDVESGPTKEERIIQFKEMLKERGVAPFSKWDKELPKIVFDPRFKAIPTHAERRSLFEHYVRKRAEEERKEKRAAQKAAIEGFKNLLEEAKEDIDEKTDYQTFRKKWGHDPRFEALSRKEREVLLNERVHSLKKAAEGKAKAARLAVASSFKSMLQERGDITTNSRWSRVKDSIRDDPRYKSVKHEERESLFNEYISDLKTAEDEAERVTKAKREEQEKLRERERETRKRKEREEQEMERIRLKVRRKEAVSSYQALLVETIKDPQSSWKEAKAKLEKDPQGRATNLDLDESDMEKLFREHIKMLNERCTHDYKALLAEVITIEASAHETEDRKTVLTSWSTAKHFLKADPRYTKMPRKDREALWRRHVDEIQRKQKVSSEGRDERHSELRHKSSTDLGRTPSGRSTRECR